MWCICHKSPYEWAVSRKTVTLRTSTWTWTDYLLNVSFQKSNLKICQHIWTTSFLKNNWKPSDTLHPLLKGQWWLDVKLSRVWRGPSCGQGCFCVAGLEGRWTKNHAQIRVKKKLMVNPDQENKSDWTHKETEQQRALFFNGMISFPEKRFLVLYW